MPAKVKEITDEGRRERKYRPITPMHNDDDDLKTISMAHSMACGSDNEMLPEYNSQFVFNEKEKEMASP